MTLLANLGAKILGFLALIFFVRSDAKKDEKIKVARANEKEAKKQAQKWADRGLKPTPKRLRELSKRKRRS